MHASLCVVHGYNNWSRQRRNFLAQLSDRLGSVSVHTNFVLFNRVDRFVFAQNLSLKYHFRDACTLKAFAWS